MKVINLLQVLLYANLQWLFSDYDTILYWLSLLLYSGYGQQLSDCRESLEQLEGYQNQELAKVKHMLLSAETSLELEKQERLKLRDQLEELQRNQTTNENADLAVQSKDTATNTPPVANTNDTDEAMVTEYILVIKSIKLPMLIICLRSYEV